MIALSWETSLPADTQTVGHSINVIEPTRDQIDLQNREVIESFSSKAFDVPLRHLVRAGGDFHGVVEHGAIRT